MTHKKYAKSPQLNTQFSLAAATNFGVNGGHGSAVQYTQRSPRSRFPRADAAIESNERPLAFRRGGWSGSMGKALERCARGAALRA